MKTLYLYLLLVSLTLTIGCDNQSPNAKFVEEMTISLGRLGGYQPTQLDAWFVNDSVGSEIYSAAFAYKCKITADGMGMNGIKIKCEITGYGDAYGWDNYGIWDKTADNGEKYGFVISDPLGSWDYDEGIAVARTSKDGECSFYIGLGLPMTEARWGNSNLGWDWPGGCDTMVATTVEVKFIIPKWNNNIEEEGYMYFIRLQCADFSQPPNYGVIHTSFSDLGQCPEGYSMSVGGVTIQLEQVDDVTPKKPAETMPVKTPPTDLPKKERRPPTNLRLHTSPILRSASTGEPNASWEYIDHQWGQYAQIYDSYWDEWYWDWIAAEDLVVLWMADPNDYEDGVGLVSYSEPYAFFCIVSLEEVGEIMDMNSFATVLLKSKDAEGNDVAWLPINMTPYLVEGQYMWLESALIVLLEHTEGQGYYWDYWGNPYAAIFASDGGYLEIQPDNLYGDFNFDSKVDFVDYQMLLNHIGKGLTNSYYNLMYDADHDGQTTNSDLAVFCQNWLETR